MHPTTTSQAERTAFGRTSSLSGALLLLALCAGGARVRRQRPDFTGGPVASNGDGKTDYPLYVPNDYTV